MSSDQLKLNIPGCQHNLAEMHAALTIIDTEKSDQLSAYGRLAEVMQGAGMEDATAYSQELSNAITGINESVNQMTAATGNASENTQQFDATQAGSQMTGSGH